MTDHSKVIERLNDLLEKSYDAEKGYKKASEDVQEARLISFFNEKAQQRYDFGHELKGEITSLGGKPNKGSSVLAGIHRAWIDIKSALSFDTTEAILEECERGEERSVAEYDEILKDTHLPASTRSILIRQRNKVAATLSQVEAMEESHD